MNRSTALRRVEEIHDELKARSKNGTATKAWVRDREAELDTLEAEIKRIDGAAKFAAAADMYPSHATKAVGGKWAPPSPLTATEDQFKSLFAATRSKVPGYSVTLGDTGGGVGSDWAIGLKSPIPGVGEGQPGSLLSPQMLPNAFPLRLEPDRVFSHFVGMAADTQAVTWMQHTGNSGAAAAVPELELKPELGMQVTSQTTSFTTLAVLQTFSRQLADDFPTWMSFVPQELTRALIDEETRQIVSGNGTTELNGLLNTSDVLERSKGSDTRIDALVNAANDIRVGPAFGNADLILLNPSTWTAVKTSKDTQGRYVLALNQPNELGSVDNLFGVPVIVNTKVPEDVAIVMDSSIAVLAWTRLGLELTFTQLGDYQIRHNALTYRLEERVAIGVQYPKAICVVDGLGFTGGS